MLSRKQQLDLLLHILLMEDSWQTHRIHNAVQGVPGPGAKVLFDIVNKWKIDYEKRAY